MSNPTFDFKTAEDTVRDVDLSSQTILITGCASGLGLETMRVLSQRGASIIGLARTQEAAQQALTRVKATGTPIACDLADLLSVQKASAAIHRLGVKIDAIVASAGMMSGKSLVQTHGVEQQFQVNYLGHFALLNSLLDVIADGRGRIVIVSSDASVKQAPKEGIRFDDISGDRTYNVFQFYGQSKLALAIYATELSRRLANRGIDVNSVHPGAVRGTALNRSLWFPLNWVLKVASVFMISVEQGAATQTLLAGNPRVKGTTGQYWADCHVAIGSKYLDDKAIAQRLWDVSERLIGQR